jgi:hypothetical protein
MVDGPKRFRCPAPKAERLSTSHSADVRRDGTVLIAPVCPESLPAAGSKGVAPDALFWILHLGIFVVWFPALVIAERRVGDPNRKDFWKLVLRDLPDGVRYLIYGFLGYAFVNFFYLFIQESNEPRGSGEPSAVVWRGFSGHWMAFYIGSLAILYSATKEKFDTTRCLNGHSVPPEGSFCA